ncbi:hypothetical protein BN2497_1541 [Janthinobacterium sp. CG23_2]|nr:hypothetical protein BN2497_1541 [Janthinobacterium sp. CG23_2]CUU27168.1 hypothetical protein BN3177_1541 [Janthinobacterium sp. CG23_2]
MTQKAAKPASLRPWKDVTMTLRGGVTVHQRRLRKLAFEASRPSWPGRSLA